MQKIHARLSAGAGATPRVPGLGQRVSLKAGAEWHYSPNTAKTSIQWLFASAVRPRSHHQPRLGQSRSTVSREHLATCIGTRMQVYTMYVPKHIHARLGNWTS